MLSVAIRVAVVGFVVITAAAVPVDLENAGAATPGESYYPMIVIHGLRRDAEAPCTGTGKVGLQSLIGLMNVGVQDIPILSS